jgi:hypothetical protein
LTTADTVATDTFARRATSRIVGVVLFCTCSANLADFESFGMSDIFTERSHEHMLVQCLP